MLLYLPANFLSVWLIDNYGLRMCIGTGSFLMFLGSLLRFMSISRNLWFWYFGHIICLSGGAFLKTPATKLATNWFGDKERGLATALGQVSIPIGLLFSQTMIIFNFDNDDKLPENRERAELRWQWYIFFQSIISCVLVTPALVLIRDKPATPASAMMVKKRPVETMRQAIKSLVKNNNFLYLCLYFQLVNTVTVYGGEIITYQEASRYTINEQTISSMLYCVTGVAGSIFTARILDQ